MSLNADICFTYNREGRMLETNEPVPSARHAAPRVFVGRTPGGAILRFGARVPPAVAHEIQTIVDQEPVPTNPLELQAPLALTDRLEQVLGQHAPVESPNSGPAFQFPEQIGLPVQVTQISSENRELARTTFPWLFEEFADWQPTFAIIADGGVASVCFSSRIGESACAAGVETLPAFRGRGYAPRVTAAWAAAVQASGRIPIYSTSWDNHASRGVARSLGLRVFGSELTWD
jgi:GNAT acetyltransferase-like protein